MVIGGLEGWVESEHEGLLAEAQHSLLLLLLGLVGVLSCHLTLGQHQQETVLVRARPRHRLLLPLQVQSEESQNRQTQGQST